MEPRLLVRQIMSKAVVTVGPRDSVAHARRMLQQNNVSALPVVVRGDVLVGIVTNKVLVHRTPGEERVAVCTVMQTRVHALPGDAEVRILALVMRTHRIHHVVVVNDRHVKGIVSSFDLLKLVEGPVTDLSEIPPGPDRTDSPSLEELVGLVLLDMAPGSEWEPGDDVGASP